MTVNEEHEQHTDFWSPDRLKNLRRKRHFAFLSTERKICVILLVIFTLIWCFYMGLSAAFAFAPKWEGDYLTADNVSAPDEDVFLPDLNHDGVQTILLVGSDKRPNDIGRTDTIIMAFIDGASKNIRLLSIPRDTYVSIPGGGKTKINHSYAYGGIPLVKSTIESNFGVAVDNYIEVDFKGFSALVDAIDGVQINVPAVMKNPVENIDLQPGVQLLDGDKALQFVRFREPLLADIGRIDRQQQFIKALADKIFSPAMIFKIPQIAAAVSANVSSDLSPKEILSLVNLVNKTDASVLELITLPGDGQYINKVSYWVMAESEKEQVIRYMMGQDSSDIPAEGGNGGETEQSAL
jgi:LCP family protein required for cell wall assembly